MLDGYVSRDQISNYGEYDNEETDEYFHLTVITVDVPTMFGRVKPLSTKSNGGFHSADCLPGMTHFSPSFVE